MRRRRMKVSRWIMISSASLRDLRDLFKTPRSVQGCQVCQVAVINYQCCYNNYKSKVVPTRIIFVTPVVVLLLQLQISVRGRGLSGMIFMKRKSSNINSLRRLFPGEKWIQSLKRIIDMIRRVMIKCGHSWRAPVERSIMKTTWKSIINSKISLKC